MWVVSPCRSSAQFFNNPNYRESAVATRYERRCALAAALKERQIQRLLGDEAARNETVARQHFAVVRHEHGISAVALIFKSHNAVGAPAYLHLVAAIEVTAHELVGVKERRVVARTRLQPCHKLSVVGMTNITRQHIQRSHAWRVLVAYIVVKTLQRGCRHGCIVFLLKHQREHLEVGGRSKCVLVFLLYETLEFFYFW